MATPNQSVALSNFQAVRDDARRTYVSSPTNANKKLIIDASERAGEAAADVYFVTALRYTSLDCAFGNGKQGQFDRVYAKYSGTTVTEVIVVECKGGTSPLGCRGRNQQGSKDYFESIMLNIQNKLDGSSPPSNATTLQATIDIIDNAKSSSILKYYQLRLPFNTNGEILPTQISKFDITWP